MYYWRVKAQTGAGWGDFSFVNDFSIGIVPDKVEITSENITVINKDTYTITWKKGDSTVTRYLVQLATDDYFIEGYMNVNDSFVVNTSYTFTNISYDSSYYYRVAAMNDAMWSEFSEQRQFSRVQLPDQAKPVYPVDKFVTKNPGVRFGWMADPDPDAYYSLEIAKDSAMVQNIFIDATIIDTFKMVSVLQRGNTYYWRVRVSNINGWGEYSPIRTLEIQNPGGVHEDYIAQMVHLTASPNPASGDVTISFDLPTSQKASLSILNPLGQTIATLVDGFQNSGNQAYIWNASDNAQGVYYYQLRFGNSVLTYPIVLVK
ncbi:MAG: fibronectin type III domain-containing protein [Ignavibacteria bacterium]|nr:fibronectin type III domain-containing protein [Ignavibacteria bacterium]